MKKRILIIHNSDKIGGAEISLYNLVKYLPKNKYDCWVVLPAPGQVSELIAPYVTGLFYFPLVRLRCSLNLIYVLRLLYAVFLVSIHISRCIRKYGITTIYANSYQALIYAVLPKIITGRLLLWHCRDNVRSQSIRMMSAFCDRIICCSQFINDQLGSGAKNAVIHNGIDTALWKPSEIKMGPLRHRLGIGEGTCIVAQIANLVPWKRHDEFIAIAKEVAGSFDSVHFVIVGTDFSGDSSQYLSALRKAVKDNALDRRLTFLGFQADMLAVIREIDILVHPTPQEPFGRVLIEAMALEKPVVASNSGGAAEIVLDGETGFLIGKAGTRRTFADRIIRLLNDKAMRDLQGRRGRHRVIDHFDISGHIEQMCKQIDQL